MEHNVLLLFCQGPQTPQKAAKIRERNDNCDVFVAMSESPDDGKPAASEGVSLTVMVVDPDILSRMVISEYLRECGHKVVEGVRAEDVLNLLEKQHHLDVVLSEVEFGGGMSSLELGKTIREKWPEIDVILVHSKSRAVEKATELCDEGPLERPYHPQEIVRRINLLRERRRTLK